MKTGAGGSEIWALKGRLINKEGRAAFLKRRDICLSGIG
jgi:hypothetical protein